MEVNRKAKLLVTTSKRAIGNETDKSMPQCQLEEGDARQWAEVEAACKKTGAGAPYRNGPRSSSQKASTARAASTRGRIRRNLGRMIPRTMSCSLLIGPSGQHGVFERWTLCRFLDIVFGGLSPRRTVRQGR
uniref:Uncharacterized protein n=1 Tax=Nelumbo nucifera TaxID=4432 RepID=A0A822Z2L5_NELNU|nr:TPA_asm: hypothetical protein HUJ06_008582 [Nelumbo nucifera]